MHIEREKTIDSTLEFQLQQTTIIAISVLISSAHLHFKGHTQKRHIFAHTYKVAILTSRTYSGDTKDLFDILKSLVKCPL